MKHLSILLFLFISVNFFAQTPGAFSYQAIVRNVSGDIVENQEVVFQISILQDSDAGPSVYTERHSITTNDYGLANLQIGNGTLVSGSFGPEGWGETPHFIKVEFDPNGGNSFTELSTTQLLAVPYAFHAQTVENDKVNDADADPANEIQSLAISGNDLSISDGNTITLPEGATSPWTEDGDDIYFNSGKIGIGTVPGADLRKFQVIADDVQAIAAVNNSSYPAIFAQNTGGGSAAEFLGNIIIEDGTEGDGKVLTSDASGEASWQNPGNLALWLENGSDIYFESSVGIGNFETSSPGHDLDLLNSTSSIRIKSTTAGIFDGDAFLILDKASTANNANLNLRSEGTSQFYAGLLGDNNFSISTNLSTLNGLEVQSSGDMTISGELQTPATGDANMVPIAYGTVVSGTLRANSGNVSVSENATGSYVVSIDNENYLYTDYIVSLTIVGDPGFIESSSVSGNLLVYTYDTSGARVDANFHFVVYKP